MARAFFFTATDLPQVRNFWVSVTIFQWSLSLIFLSSNFFLYGFVNDCKVIHSIAIRIKTKLLIRHIIYQFPLFIHIDIAAVHHTCAMGAVSSLGFYISHLNLSFPSPHPLPLHSFPVPVYKSLPSGNLSNSSRELSNYSYPLLKIIERLAMPSLGR